MKIRMLSFVALCLAFVGMVGGQQPQNLPFEAEILKFEAEDAKSFPAPGGIVFVGSSSIRRWSSLKQDFPWLNVLNRGFGGSQTSDSVYYAKRIVTPYKPSLVVFFAGTNDIQDGKTAETVFADWKAFVNVVHEAQPHLPMIYISITPAPSRWKSLDEVKKANKLIKDYCRRDHSLRFLDVFKKFLTKDGGPRPELFVEDQLHLKPESYSIWVKALTPMLPKPDADR